MPPTAILKQPALVRLMLGIALVILPAVAWVDYRQGFKFAAFVELAAAATLFALAFLVRPLGDRQAKRVTLFVMFALAALGSVEKLGSTPNFAWFSVMPFLYISIGGLRLGGLLTVTHFLFIAGCYLSLAQPTVAAVDLGTWIQVGLAYLTAAALAFSYEHSQRQMRRRLRALADHDALTGLLNRRGMEKHLDDLSAFLRRHDVVVTLALLDVDHFKRVNDQFGHDVGDSVLREIARELRRIFRSSDYLARWGGEEFLVALTHTDIHQASSVLERLRAEIAGLQGLSAPSVTLSMGAAEWRPGTPLATALKQADVALYEAKQAGRNRLVAVPEITADGLDSSLPARLEQAIR
ncbi:MAG: GGDEF domain-containing protein [Pseudomonadales bacterium]